MCEETERGHEKLIKFFQIKNELELKVCRHVYRRRNYWDGGMYVPCGVLCIRRWKEAIWTLWSTLYTAAKGTHMDIVEYFVYSGGRNPYGIFRREI
jgi:hypothetical protein